MSLLSSFVTSHLIPAFESAFQAHEPELQAALLKEIQDSSNAVATWLNSKIAAHSPSVI